MPHLSVTELSLDRLDEAYPLVRAVVPVSLERWRAFGRRLAGGDGGVLAAFAEDDRLHGVAAYRHESSLRHEHGFAVELIVAFELTRTGRVRRALAEALERLALSRGCRSLVYTVAASGRHDGAARPGSAWEDLGFVPDTISLVRQLANDHGNGCARRKRMPLRSGDKRPAPRRSA